MAWLQHGILEAIEVLPPIQLHVLDMNFASQLLSVGQCHWAIYVVLHMPPDRDYPGLHEKVIKEILHQYCEVWSTTESQQIFLEKELGIPSEWLHEALVQCF
jgi:nuclear pore complex protein Nup98-Nup96